jgi:type I restriction enzyme, R subunit
LNRNPAELEDDDDKEAAELSYPKALPNKYLKEPNTGHAFVYVCTIQRMAINLLGKQVSLKKFLEPSLGLATIL